MFEIKTLIELFDSCQIENVIAGLRFLPQKIVFVGFKQTMTKKRTDDLERFFAMRGINIDFEYEIVDRYDYDFIYNKLNQIIDRNQDCCFDLTGGKELVLTAMGAVSAIRDVPMLQFDVASGNLIKVKNCEDVADIPKSSMTINEIVVLNGGCVVSNESDDFKWELNEDFKNDIDIMWRLCRQKCGLWNRQCIAFGNFEKFGSIDKNLCVRADLAKLKENRVFAFVDKKLLDKLEFHKLIIGKELKNNVITFRYKNNQVRQCLTKAGNILELYTYKNAKEIAEQIPGYYDDIDIGIYVDWDGIIHSDVCGETDTRNEIDVMLMRDLIPIFISCKNGEVHKEALYELHAVAQKFGGEYARKILLTTYVSANPDSRKYILQRAHDMKITVVEGVEKMTTEEFKRILKSKAK